MWKEESKIHDFICSESKIFLNHTLEIDEKKVRNFDSIKIDFNNYSKIIKIKFSSINQTNYNCIMYTSS